jgi:hypothetical protein
MFIVFTERCTCEFNIEQIVINILTYYSSSNLIQRVSAKGNQQRQKSASFTDLLEHFWSFSNAQLAVNTAAQDLALKVKLG